MVLNPPGKDAGADDPPYSRLFVVYNRKDPVTEAEIREDFSQYGNVQDIFIVKDRSNGEPKGESAYIMIFTILLFSHLHCLFYSLKGVAYVKFAKMSEAAKAMENLNQQPIKNRTGVYKVYIAKR